jgi:hypothetical protein
VRINLRTRAVRTGSLLVALTLVGFATGATLSMTSASAIAQDFSPMTTFNGVACASASQCIGVGIAVSGVDSGAAASLDPVSGGIATSQSVQLIGPSGFLSAVSCPSASACLAVGEDPDESEGIAVPLDPDTAKVLSGQEPQTISGVVVALDPTTGTILSGQSVQTVPGTGGVGLEGVACPTATLCVAVGENSGRSAGVAVPLDPGTGAILGGQSVQSVTRNGILVAVACPSITLCLAVGWGASQPSVAVPIDPNTGALSNGQSDQSISAGAAMLTAVSCPSSSLCLAVGNDTADPSIGQAVPIDPTTAMIAPGEGIQTLTGTGSLNAVVCPSTDRCVAAGSSFESTGAITEILDPATGMAPGSSTTPTTTPGTTPTVTPSTSSSSSQELAATGIDLAPLLALGVGCVLGGFFLISSYAPFRRKRSRTQ